MTSPQTLLIQKVTSYVETHMSAFDGSHDFNHIKRVVGLAHEIYHKTATSTSNPEPVVVLDKTVITLSALLHDVGDRKYVQEGAEEDPQTMIRDVLVSFGATRELAEKIQAICLGVSFNSEIKDLGHVRELIVRYPELAVVQDADRLDSIGAVGIGRLFTYGGAKAPHRGMGGSVDHMGEKLYKLEAMMKTAAGKEMARVRTERLRVFESWWDEEMAAGNVGEEVIETEGRAEV